MGTDGKLMHMLTAYAAAHQHPFNIFVHLLGIPAIMFGVLVPLGWVNTGSGAAAISLAHVLVLGFFLFYMTLDRVFAVAFLLLSLLLLQLATGLAGTPSPAAAGLAAAAFFGGYVAQFIGHAVEKSMPVLIRHPVQANLAAPFFTVVELFRLAGLRRQLFNELQQRVAALPDR